MSGFLAFGIFLGCYHLVLVKMKQNLQCFIKLYFVIFAFKTLRFPSMSFRDLNAAQFLQSVEEL